MLIVLDIVSIIVVLAPAVIESTYEMVVPTISSYATGHVICNACVAF
jgi:hypothetical protein